MQSVTDAGRRAPRRDAPENRAALLTAAAAALSETPDASLETIAAAAGLTRRAVYGHFANREALVLALIDSGAERLNAIAAMTDHAHTPTAIALLGARLWTAVEHVRLLAGMAVREPYTPHVADALEPVRARIRELVERGVADGTVRSDIRPTTLARLVEESAIAVLLEAATTRMVDAEGRRLVQLAVLSTVGLSWRDAGALIDSTPELAGPSAPEAGR
jgi:AcrR family transcriptional regulator